MTTFIVRNLPRCGVSARASVADVAGAPRLRWASAVGNASATELLRANLRADHDPTRPRPWRARMIFEPTPLARAYVIDLERRGDDRGFFARAFCEREFEAHGLPVRMVQTNVSRSRDRGTLRGMHYQRPPHAEDKLVRCTHGAIYDVIVDIREGSETFCQWFGVELRDEDFRMLLIPKGFAHGFLTLTDDVEVVYQVSAFYEPGAEGGARYDDPAFGIHWPAEPTLVSDKDRSWPDFAAGVVVP